jgi:hypothetical protein
MAHLVKRAIDIILNTKSAKFHLSGIMAICSRLGLLYPFGTIYLIRGLLFIIRQIGIAEPRI